MPKAVLVMDMPEQVCYKCSLCYEVLPVGDYYMCAALGKEIPDGEIPDWCPLRELPEKKDCLAEAIKNECHDGTESDCAYLEGKSAGWNACLEEITGKHE